MNKIICDVCGKEIPNRNPMNIKLNCRTVSGEFNYYPGFYIKKYDLCEEHADAIKQFIDELAAEKKETIRGRTLRGPQLRRTLPFRASIRKTD